MRPYASPGSKTQDHNGLPPRGGAALAKVFMVYGCAVRKMCCTSPRPPWPAYPCLNIPCKVVLQNALPQPCLPAVEPARPMTLTWLTTRDEFLRIPTRTSTPLESRCSGSTCLVTFLFPCGDSLRLLGQLVTQRFLALACFVPCPIKRFRHTQFAKPKLPIARRTDDDCKPRIQMATL